MKKYYIKDKDQGNIVYCFQSLNDAEKFINDIKDMDAKDGYYYKESPYMIIEKEERTMLDTIINRIKSRKFNFENVMRKGSYYGAKCNIMPLFCSYGQIGYTIETDFGTLEYDYEFNKITLNFN